jgi:hypothetical protein
MHHFSVNISNGKGLKNIFKVASLSLYHIPKSIWCLEEQNVFTKFGQNRAENFYLKFNFD